MVGFDDDDRKFRPPPKRLVVLECEHCGTSDGQIILRQNWYREAEAVLCAECWKNWG